MSENVSNQSVNFDLGGSIFWMLMILISLVSLVYFALWSYHNESIKGAVISVVYFMMIVSGVLLSKFEIFNFGSWSSDSLSFVIAFIPYFFVGMKAATNSTLAILSLERSYLFSTIVSELPTHIEYVLDMFLIPIAEDVFWVVGLPFVLFTVFEQFGKMWKPFDNKVIHFILVLLICGVSFAGFHIGRSVFSYLVAAFIFRTFTIGIVYADIMFDVFKNFRLVAAASLGAHIGNNIGSVIARNGFSNVMGSINQNLFPMNIVIFIFFGLLLLSAFNQIGIFIKNRIGDVV